MSAEESAAIRAYRDQIDNAIIHWARALRDAIHEITDDMLAKVAADQVEPDSWRDAS